MCSLVNDYRPLIIDVAYADDKLPLFTSDFGKVVEFFALCRKYGKNQIREHMKLSDIRHVEEVVALLSLFSGIPRDDFLVEGGNVEMTSALRGMQEHWEQKGRVEGREEGLRILFSLIAKKRLSLDEAVAESGLSKEDFLEIARKNGFVLQ